MSYDRFIPAQAGNTLLSPLSRLPPTVHPRAGGEHLRSHCVRIRSVGSSPRRRGTRHTKPPCRGRRRFIPAQAGNTERSQFQGEQEPVHPRAGGEHVEFPSKISLIVGSSPRRRGTPCRSPRTTEHRRFIPAQAGNTRSAIRGSEDHPVHPRAGGEHKMPPACSAAAFGSSPRRRGTPLLCDDPHTSRRFIPAQAGNTYCGRRLSREPSVHPRAGGEHLAWDNRRGAADGSSPRRRGTPTPQVSRRVRCRFIPAQAGNTNSHQAASNRVTVHPRAGGEHSSTITISARYSGSSPRRRGTPGPGTSRYPSARFIPAQAGNTPTAMFRSARTRFIPAQAGNTWPEASARSTSTVHPRAGGEHMATARTTSSLSGSSPRRRGTHVAKLPMINWERFIPAQAGNTR